MHRIALFMTSTLLLAVTASAQDALPREHVRTFTFVQDESQKTPAIALGNMMFQREKLLEGEVSFFAAEMAGTGEVVTAAPYTATANTESTQILSDGNRIVNKTSALVARDSQGRTRRETSVHRIGQLQVDSPKLVFINDPTTHTQYILQGGEATKVIRREGTWSEGPQIIDLHGTGERGIKTKVMVRTQGGAERRKESDSPEQIKHENLGTQTIEGVSAEGKRETVTIPAGQIGNERPIEIVSESWFSPELHTMVLRRHSDPRVGETIFRLTDIKRNEPDASLFQAPAGSRVNVEPLLEMHREPAPPKE